MLGGEEWEERRTNLLLRKVLRNLPVAEIWVSGGAGKEEGRRDQP